MKGVLGGIFVSVVHPVSLTLPGARDFWKKKKKEQGNLYSFMCLVETNGIFALCRRWACMEI